MRKKKFAVAILDADNKTFVLHITALAKLRIMLIYYFCEALVTLLISTKFFAEYSNFLDIFSSNSAAELLKNIRINDHPITLLEDKQPFYGQIYSLRLVKLEILNTYIKVNLASGFFRLSKSFADILILFVWKKNDSLHIYVDYSGFHNLIIKNCYLQFLIGESIDNLSRTKHFT